MGYSPIFCTLFLNKHISMKHFTVTILFAAILASAISLDVLAQGSFSNDTIVYNPPPKPTPKRGTSYSAYMYHYGGKLNTTSVAPNSKGNLVLSNNGKNTTDEQWLNMPLTLNAGQKITGFKVCYSINGNSKRTYISAIKLIETIPDGKAIVKYKEEVHLTASSPDCHSSVCSYKATEKPVIVALKVSLSGKDTITIDSVEPMYE
jgi:hypothetical protein